MMNKNKRKKKIRKKKRKAKKPVPKVEQPVPKVEEKIPDLIPIEEIPEPDPIEDLKKIPDLASIEERGPIKIVDTALEEVKKSLPKVEKPVCKPLGKQISYHTIYNRKRKLKRNGKIVEQYNMIMNKIGGGHYGGDCDCGLMKMKSRLFDHLVESFLQPSIGPEQIEKIKEIKDDELRNLLLKDLGIGG